jgi:hypothetical protein
MKSPQLVHNILASAAVAAVLSIPHRATATDLQPLVITDIPHDAVAIRHSVPPYPRNAHTLRIGGDVRLILEVERGHIVSITAQRGPRRRIATHKCHRWLSMTPTQTRIWELFRRLWLLECVEHEHRLEGDILNLPVSHVGQAPDNIT